MSELSSTFSAFHHSSTTTRKKSVCTFLDCCHSGKFIERGGGRSIENIPSDFGKKAKENLKAEGEVGMASMDGDETSREKLFGHISKPEEHFHGIFTYHLIEGLEGKAAERGIITFDGLRKHMLKAMENEQQQLQLLAEGGGGVLDLKIALAPEEILNTYIEKLKRDCNILNENNIYIVQKAAASILELKYYTEYQSYSESCRQKFLTYLQKSKSRVSMWINDNITENIEYRNEIDKIDPTLYDVLALLDSTTFSSLSEFTNTDRFRLCLIDALYLVMNNPKNATVKAFIDKCGYCVKRRSQETETGTPKLIISEARSGPKKLDVVGPKE